MIEVNFYPNGFTARGHALTAPAGSDLVCAGVSAIIIGALNWFDAPDTVIHLNAGEGITCFFEPESHPKYVEWLELMRTQLEALGQPGRLAIRQIQTKGDPHDN